MSSETARAKWALPRPDGDATGRQNMLQLVQLRWMAVCGQVATIAFVHLVLDIPLPLTWMALTIGGLVALNLFSTWRLRHVAEVSNTRLLLALLCDVAALTSLLYLSGGATNPFVFLYLLQVTLGAVLLDARSTWALVGVTSLCFALLTRVYVPLDLPPEEAGQLFQLHILGMLICFVLDVGLLVVFTTRINRNLRARDARLADLRQRAAEEDHIVRMGLLASGAAHELGTPLSTLSVILGDWRRMPPFRDDPDMAQEIADMQAEVLRCKTIVTGILMAAGEARGESPLVTSVRRFVATVIDDWRDSRASVELRMHDRFGEDVHIVSDSALKQVIHNVLDNALEASQRPIDVSLSRENGDLCLTVEDRGPGFAADVLANFGKPYQSTKGRPGGGLGLFLVTNVMRKFGGRVTAANRPGGGARVVLQLPLDAVRIGDGDDDTDPDPEPRSGSAADRRGRRGVRPHAEPLA